MRGAFTAWVDALRTGQGRSLMLSLSRLSWARAGVLAVVGAVLGGMTPSAGAQTAGEIAQTCIQAVRATALEAGSDIQRITENTAARIAELDENDAPNAAIVAEGREGKERIRHRAEAASNRVHTLVVACVEELNALGAPEGLIARVREAGRNAQRLINEARERGVRRVDRAVRMAVED